MNDFLPKPMYVNATICSGRIRCLLGNLQPINALAMTLDIERVIEKYQRVLNNPKIVNVTDDEVVLV